MKKMVFKVSGMHCRSCELLLEESLKDAGAGKVRASASEGILELEADEKKLGEAKVRSIIMKEGFEIL